MFKKNFTVLYCQASPSRTFELYSSYNTITTVEIPSSNNRRPAFSAETYTLMQNDWLTKAISSSSNYYLETSLRLLALITSKNKGIFNGSMIRHDERISCAVDTLSLMANKLFQPT